MEFRKEERNNQNISLDDVIFFMDMLNHPKSPNFVISDSYQTMPYNKILKKPESDEYKRFIKIYNASKHILSSREQEILNDTYGTRGSRLTFTQISKSYGITANRIRQIARNAEHKIVMSLIRR